MNPFLINTYVSPGFFCNRQQETKSLLGNITNGANTAFFAQRRLGKTALIQHAFYYLRKKKYHCIYLDIYATQNLKDFTNQLAASIYQVFPENKGLGKKFLEAIRLLRPVISFDEISGSPSLTLDITQPRQIEKTIPQLLQFLDAQQKNIVIAIDEFQQILQYPEKNVEALLRTVIQHLQHVTFIFCGSNQKMMQEIFSSSKRPFYASTSNIHLKKIDLPSYSDFIKTHFTSKKIRISQPTIDLILELSSAHTYYTQRLCHELFAGGHSVITEETVHQCLNNILLDNESNYFQYRNLLTTSQWQLLRAIATDEKVEQPFAGKFISRYQLGTPASVKRSLEALQEKEMVFNHLELKNSYYEINDKFLMRWLQRL